MTDTRTFAVQTEGVRLDHYLASQLPDLSRSYLQRLIGQGHVVVQGRSAKAGMRLLSGDRITVVLPQPEPLALEPQSMPLRIVFENQDLLVIDKPPGVAVHPAPGHTRDTIVNALLALCPDLSGIGGKVRPGIVHRLDKDTSGLLMVAKNDKAHRDLSQQLKSRAVVKQYLALVTGRLMPREGVIEASIGRHPRNRKRMAVVAQGQPASTAYRVMEYLADCSLVEVAPKTGRTHQIRVHLASVGHPIVGDRVYGKASPLVARQFLHACFLSFKLPGTGEVVELRSDVPQDLQLGLEQARSGANAAPTDVSF